MPRNKFVGCVQPHPVFVPVRRKVEDEISRCRAVSFSSFGKIRFKTAFEQDLWLDCCRLIANSIIFYNASILSRLLEHQERIGDMQAADATKKVSPIAWQHINLHGRYES